MWAHTYTPEVGARSERGRCVALMACVRVRPAADSVRVCRVSDYVGASGVRYGRKCYDHSYSSWAYFFGAAAGRAAPGRSGVTRRAEIRDDTVILISSPPTVKMVSDTPEVVYIL